LQDVSSHNGAHNMSVCMRITVRISYHSDAKQRSLIAPSFLQALTLYLPAYFVATLFTEMITVITFSNDKPVGLIDVGYRLSNGRHSLAYPDRFFSVLFP
jgi:hypothetical protein